MAYDQTVIERLETLLNRAEADREKVQEELDNMRAHATWHWARHTTIEEGDDPLPVPRLEIVAENVSGDWYVTDWTYSMVYRHLLKHHVRVPLGSTRCTGGRGLPPEHTPFRDGAHIKNEAQQFGWPAFAIVGDRVRRIELD